MKRLFDVGKGKIPSNLLQERFLVPPFSVFDTRQGYWQERKRNWIKLGIQSDLGRGDKLLYNIGYWNYPSAKMAYTSSGVNSCLSEEGAAKYGRKAQQTSIFDPVLCEIAYKWFSVKGARVLDPFAGGSVRGMIAGMTGRKYFGVDLSESQIEANEGQYREISSRYARIEKPVWVNGDSMNVKEFFKDANGFDLVFSCPPYYNLEVYSSKEEDLSNKGTYDEFLSSYREIINRCCSMLIDNSFAVFVVANLRDKDGFYYDFVGDTVRAFQSAGLRLYNEAIVLNIAGTLPIRSPGQFNSSRKLGKQHQQFLVFYKGDASKIREKFGSYE